MVNIDLVNVSNATITGNEITHTGGSSINIYAGITLNSGSNNVISDNILLGSDIWRPYDNAGIAIGYPSASDESFGSNGSEATYNQITGNQIGMGEGFGIGIIMGSAENNTISGNTIKLCRTVLHLGPLVRTLRVFALLKEGHLLFLLTPDLNYLFSRSLIVTLQSCL